MTDKLNLETDTSGAANDFRETASAVKELTDALRKLGSLPTEQVSAHFDKMRGSIEKVASSLEMTTSQLGKTLHEAGKNAGTQLAGGMGKGLEESVPALKSRVARVQREIQGTFDQFGTFISNAQKAQAADAARALMFNTGDVRAATSQAQREIKGHYTSLGLFVQEGVKELEALAAKNSARALMLNTGDVRAATTQAQREIKGHYTSLGLFVQEGAKELEALAAKNSARALLLNTGDVRAATSQAQREIKGHYTSLGLFVQEGVKELEALAAKNSARALMLNSADVRAATHSPSRPSAVRYDSLMNVVPPAGPSQNQADSDQTSRFRSAQVAADAIRRAGEESRRSAREVGFLSGSLNDLHSAARGVASGFGAMWLTWGHVAPLLAGAALSNGFVKAVRSGSEFTNTMVTLGALTEATGLEINSVAAAAIELGRNGPQGPIEMAQAMKTLGLAGLTTKEQLQAIGSVKVFSTVAETDMQSAASGLIAISTAYGYSAKDLSVVSDVVAKTAASSMASVTDMTEAFKQASVIGQQYKVSIEDTSTLLGLLAQVGITGSAAGTSVRNMYTELMGSSRKAREILKDTLKVDVWDNQTKAMKPLPAIVEQLTKSLAEYDSKSQQSILTQLGNERGTKALSAALESVITKYQGATNGPTIFDKMRKDLSDAPGYAAEAAAVMAQSTSNQMKSVVSSLEAALIEAFGRSEGAVQGLAASLQGIFSSDEFRGSVSSLVATISSGLQVLIDYAPAILKVAEAIAVVKAATLGWSVALWAFGQGLIGLEAARQVLYAVSGAMGAVKLALVDGVPLATGLATAFGAVGPAVGAGATAMGALAAVAAPLTGILLAVAGAYAILSETTGDYKLKATKSSDELDRSEKGLMGTIDSEIKRLDALAKLRAEGVTGAEAAAEATRRLASQEIDSIAQHRLALIDDQEATIRATAAKRKFWMSWIPGMADDVDSGMLNSLKELDVQRQSVEGARQKDQEKARSAREKAKAEAKSAADDLANAAKSRLTGAKVFDPNTLGQHAKGSVTDRLFNDNSIKELEKRYDIALQKEKDYAQARQEVLDAARQAEAISAGTAAARELDLVRFTESQQLAILREARANVLDDFARQEAKIDVTVAKVKSGKGTDDQKKVALGRLDQDRKNLQESQKTFLDGLDGKQAKLESSVYARVQKLADQATGAVRKLDEEQRKFTLGEQRRSEDLATQVDLTQQLAGVSAGLAEVLRAEAGEKKRLLDLDRAQADQVFELQRQKADFEKEAKGGIDYLLTGNFSPEEKAALDSYVAQLERIAQLRKEAQAGAGTKVAEVGAATATQQLAGMGTLDLGASFDSAAVSVDGLTLSLSGAVKAMQDLHTSQELYDKARSKEGIGAEELAKLDKDRFKASIKGTADLLGATKGFFKEKTLAYKALDTVEKGYRVAQIAMAAADFAQQMGWISAKTMAVLWGQSAETAGVVAGENERNLAKTPGVFMAFMSALGPWGMAAAGAAVALVLGSGGKFGSSSSGIAGMKPNTGTGTVLGDSSAQSESIVKSSEYLSKLVDLTGVGVGYSAKMVDSLQNLINQIGGVTTIVSRSGALGAASAGIKTGFESNAFGGALVATGHAYDQFLSVITLGITDALGLGDLGKALGAALSKGFGTSSKVTGSGLYLAPTKFSDITSGNLNLQSYADIEEKKKTLYITTSTDRYTKFQGAGEDANRQFSLVLQSLGKDVASAADVLMGGGAMNKLQGYTTSIGKLDTNGMNDKQVTELLTSVFSREGDLIAEYLLPGIKELSVAGESSQVTLMKYAGSLQSINQVQKDLGQTLFESSLAGAKLAVSLVAAFGDVDKYSSAMQKYYDTFYTEQEKTATASKRLSDALRALGIKSIPTTIAGYREMVDQFVAGGGLMTEAGQATYAELIKLSEPFASITDAAKKMSDELVSSADSIMEYVNKLTADRAGLATPAQQLSAAKSTYLSDLASAQGGNADALGRVTSSADAYIAAQKSFTASSDITQTVIDQVLAELTALSNSTKASVPKFASGGYHDGGWAMVGEQGPELAYFGSSARIYNAQDTRAMGSDPELAAEIRALRQQVAALMEQQDRETRALISSNMAGHQAAADSIVTGVSECSDRQSWVQQSKPELK